MMGDLAHAKLAAAWCNEAEPSPESWRDRHRHLRLGQALANAIHLMTQHAASVDVSDKNSWLASLVAFLIRQPLWLVGRAAAAGGFAFQAVALHSGQLSVVQTLLVTQLVFSLILRRFWVHQHIVKMAWTAALVACGALAVFLSAAEPHGGHLHPEAAA